tara:strand:+ start:8624 stop:9262 length:639 start_codon:yes stop_codon:yes gene_type:complete
MAKPRKKRRRSTAGKSTGRSLNWGVRVSGAQKRKDRRLLIVLVGLPLVALGAYLWQQFSAGRDFDALARSGAAALEQVRSRADFGRSHLPIGQPGVYPARYPTSGDHDQLVLRPGFYDKPQPAARVVHALEHGNVVAYVGDLSDAQRDMLKNWTGLFTGRLDGFVVVPDRRLGPAVMLSAWRRNLELERFDAPAMAAFVDAYRGRGPELPVR